MKSRTVRFRFVLTLVMFLSIAVTLAFTSVFALGLSEDYPFKTGDDAFVNGVTWTGPTEQADYWQFFQASFDDATVDLSSATHLAVQIRMDVGSPGLTYGLIENGDRYATAGAPDDTNECFFVAEDGTVSSIGNINFGALWLTEGTQGMLLLPMASLAWQWNNNGSDLTSVSSFYITTNSQYNWAWQVTIGEIGFYTGDPEVDGTYTSLLDLKAQPKTDKYYYDSQTTTSLDLVKPVYPYSNLDTAFNGGVNWTNTLTEASAADTWQTLFVNFKNNVDLTDAKYIGIQYSGNLGSPGITYGIESGNTRYSTVSDGLPVYMMDETGLISGLDDVLYGAVNIPADNTGVLLIPIETLVYQFGDVGNTLATAKNIVLTTNSKYNFNWSVIVGGVGFYNGDIGDEGTVYTPIEIDYYYNAIPADCTMETINVNHYPFDTDLYAFNGGQLWTGPTEASAADTWETMFVNFNGTYDLTSAEYLVVQYEGNLGAPGITWGIESGDARYATMVDGNSIYFMDEVTGEIEEVTQTLYASISTPQDKKGALIIPMSAFTYQFGDAGNTLATAKNIVLTTNSKYNFNWALSVGGIGYYDGEIGAEGTTYTSIDVDYYFNAGANCQMETINYQEWSMAETLVYPYRTGELAFENGKTWVAPATGSEVDDWQTMTVSFDEATVDFTNASYLAIQFDNTIGNPGLTIGLTSGTGRYSIAGVADGEAIYGVNELGDITTACNVLFSAATTSVHEGMLLIPMSAMDWQWNPDSNTLATVSNLVITTTRKYNYNYQVTIGEIGYYTGEIGEEGTTFTKILDLSIDKSDKFALSGDVTNEATFINPIERRVYGDTFINVTGTGKSSDNFGIWSGGSYGSVAMTTDTYGDTAMQFQATGSNPAGDAYTAIDLSPGGFSWANAEGITFWARNDSDGEVSFNFEVDCKIEASGLSDRFNIQQGHRYYLYDVNTGLTYIYMTKPTVNLPVGFEGWLRVPFEAFERAAWSVNGVTKDDFMTEGTIVSYLAITIHSPSYTNMAFSLNKIGSYTIVPQFISPFLEPSESRKTILDLMDLALD